MESSYVAYKIARWFGIAFVFASMYLFCEVLADLGFGATTAGSPAYHQLLFSIVFGTLGFLAYNNFVYLKMDDEGVLILRKEQKKLLLWKDIKSVFRIFGTSPPLYGMKFRNSRIICIFGMHSKLQLYIEMPWILIGGDGTGVVNYVREKTA